MDMLDQSLRPKKDLSVSQDLAEPTPDPLLTLWMKKMAPRQLSGFF
jgi:hypothetical protein